MRKKGVLIGALLLLLLLLGVGCASSSAYLLTAEYYNPNVDKVERTQVGVSQYVYEGTDVGDEYSFSIKTSLLGIRFQVTEYSPTGQLAFLDILPIVFPIVIIVGSLLWPILVGRGTKTEHVITGVIGVMLAVFIVSTTAPEFATIGTIVDKTFVIR